MVRLELWNGAALVGPREKGSVCEITMPGTDVLISSCARRHQVGLEHADLYFKLLAKIDLMAIVPIASGLMHLGIWRPQEHFGVWGHQHANARLQISLSGSDQLRWLLPKPNRCLRIL
jgi:hypothetical protein